MAAWCHSFEGEALVGKNFQSRWSGGECWGGWTGFAEEGGRKGSFADDGNGVDVILSTTIFFGKEELMELERLEDRMKKDCVRLWLDGMLGYRYLVYIFLLFLLLSIAYLVTRKKIDNSVT